MRNTLKTKNEGSSRPFVVGFDGGSYNMMDFYDDDDDVDGVSNGREVLCLFLFFGLS